MKKFIPYLVVPSLFLVTLCSGGSNYIERDPSRLPYEDRLYNSQIKLLHDSRTEKDIIQKRIIERFYDDMVKIAGDGWKRPIVAMVPDITCPDGSPDCVLVRDIQAGLCAYMGKRGISVVTGHRRVEQLESPEKGLHIQIEMSLGKFYTSKSGRAVVYAVRVERQFAGPNLRIQNWSGFRTIPPSVTLDFP